MEKRVRSPGPALSAFVDCLCLAEGSVSTHARERVLPTGTVELVVDLRPDAPGPSGSSEVCGAHSTPFVLDRSQPSSVLLVHFKPGGAFPFLGLPAHAVRERRVPLDLVWQPSVAAELRERLLLARSPDERFDVLERFLTGLAGHQSGPDPAVAFALRRLRRTAGTERIADLTEAIGFSHRHFLQLFVREVGLTPKRFARVLRFHEVLGRLDTHRVDWAILAARCGYSDQSHLSHEFRALSGLSPGQYLTQRARDRCHVPMPSA